MKQSRELLEQAASAQSGALRERYSALASSIRCAEDSIRRYAHLAERVGELERELIDARIADRAAGLLANGGDAVHVLEAIEAYVAGVMRAARFDKILRQAATTLQEELAERRLTSQAKAVLQSAYGMPEQQAHLHLQNVSRNSRKPLKDVARELIEARYSPWINQP